jgi:hypothetical protein
MRVLGWGTGPFREPMASVREAPTGLVEVTARRVALENLYARLARSVPSGYLTVLGGFTQKVLEMSHSYERTILTGNVSATETEALRGEKSSPKGGCSQDWLQPPR